MLHLVWIMATLVASASADAPPVPVSFCDLLADRAAYNHQRIEVTAFVSHGFENFTLFDPRCESDMPGIWVEYGGSVSSGTIYCCGPHDERTPDAPLIVDGVSVGLVRDDKLKAFDTLISSQSDVLLRATIRGRFFSGEKQQWPGGTIWGGYGHFGMFSLLAIEQIVAIEPHDLPGIDYRPEPDQPSFGRNVCFSQPIGRTSEREAMKRQGRADDGTESWRFDDDRRVAMETLSEAYGPDHRVRLTKVKRTVGRAVYRGRSPGSRHSYMVVVSRPYWLTVVAACPGRVAWVAIAAFESGCDTGN
jgi:hypothetical protein